MAGTDGATRANVTASVLCLSCACAASWLPKLALGEGATLTTRNAEVLALVTQVCRGSRGRGTHVWLRHHQLDWSLHAFRSDATPLSLTATTLALAPADAAHGRHYPLRYTECRVAQP